MNLRDLWKWLKAEFRWRVLGKRCEIQLTEEAKRQLGELPEEAREEIRKAMERISRNPYSGERTELEEEEAENDEA
jgi:phage-related protein